MKTEEEESGQGDVAICQPPWASEARQGGCRQVLRAVDAGREGAGHGCRAGMGARGEGA